MYGHASDPEPQGVDLRGLPEWMRAGACVGRDLAPFFPSTGQSADRAVAFCRVCTVRDECLAYALEERMDDGVWGGLTAPERARYRRDPSR